LFADGASERQTSGKLGVRTAELSDATGRQQSGGTPDVLPTWSHCRALDPDQPIVPTARLRQKSF
jgi:hypothetical protein